MRNRHHWPGSNYMSRLASEMDDQDLGDLDEQQRKIACFLEDQGYGRIVRGWNWQKIEETYFFEMI